MEKKTKQFDRIVLGWKGKVDDLSMDLDNTQVETRQISSELIRVKNDYSESILQLRDVCKNIKKLSHKIKDTMDQMSREDIFIYEDAVYLPGADPGQSGG